MAGEALWISMSIKIPISDGLYISQNRPERNWIRLFVRFYPYTIGILVSTIILFSMLKTSIPITILTIASYWIYLIAKILYRRNSNWGIYYKSKWLQFCRAFFLTTAIAFLLLYLQNYTHHNKTFNNRDTVWLLYLLPLFIMSQRGSRSLLLLSSVITSIAMVITDPSISYILHQSSKASTEISILLSKILWLNLLSLIFYIFLRYMGDTIADFNLILNIQYKLREVESAFVENPTTFDEIKYLEKLVEGIVDDFNYEHVNIFRLDEHNSRLSCIAAGSDAGKKLVDTKFYLDLDIGKSIICHVVASSKSYISNNVVKDRHYLYHPAFPKTKSELSVPIIVKNKLYGLIDVQVKYRDYFLDQDLKAIEILANHISWVIDNTEKIEHLNWINGILDNIAGPILSQNDLLDTLQEIADAAKHELKADLVVLFGFESNKSNKILGPIYSGKAFNPEEMGASIQSDDNVVNRIRYSNQDFYENRNLNSSDLSSHQFFSPTKFHIANGIPNFIIREKIESNIIIRLMNNEECVGILFLNFRSSINFTKWGKRRFFSFANLAAIAIQKMQSYDQMLRLEMTELGENVHDILVGDALGLYKLLEVVTAQNDKVAKSDPIQHQKYLDQALVLTRRLHNDIQSISSVYRKGNYYDLSSELEYLEKIYAPSMRVKFSRTIEGGNLSEIPHHLKRIIQLILREAVTNSIHHGEAFYISFLLTISEKTIHIVISDDGKGFLPEKVKHHGGTNNMKKRATKAGGTYLLESHPNMGTTITITFPHNNSNKTI